MSAYLGDPCWPDLTKEMIEYSPQFATHVQGRIEKRAFKDGLPEPQKIFCKCIECGETWQTTCAGGTPRQWVNKFATTNHLHRDPLEVGFNARTKKLTNDPDQ